MNEYIIVKLFILFAEAALKEKKKNGVPLSKSPSVFLIGTGVQFDSFKRKIIWK